jgi:pyruvate formate lyase activating enzyme
LIIGGLQKVTLIDFPGKVAAAIFTRGCNFRCPYCHNPELVDPARYVSPIDEESLFSYLEKRAGKLQGVVITGGEPTIHEDLASFAGRIRSLGYALKLDTNGSNPGMLENLLAENLLDCVALDVKAPLRRYAEVTRAPTAADSVRCSLSTLIRSHVPHEIRTTYAEPLLCPSDLAEIAEEVHGCDLLVLQAFRPGSILDPGTLALRPPSQGTLADARNRIESMGVPCLVR